MTVPRLPLRAFAAMTLALSSAAVAAYQVPVQTPRDSSQAQAGASTEVGVIRGRVTRADNGQPLRRAQILATGRTPQGSSRLTATTDNQGRYELTSVPAGSYSFTASRDGYLPLNYGQRRSFEPGRITRLTAGEVLESIDFGLHRPGAVVGRVVDADGEPITGATVSLLRYRFQNGVKRLSLAGSAPNLTDDLGQFRIGGVAPGNYYISASALNSGLEFDSGYLPTYYPSTSSLDEADSVSVELGQEVSLDLAVVRSRAGTISGMVTTADGRLATNIAVIIQQNRIERSRSGSTNTNVDGRFKFAEVPPGSYTLKARLTSPAGEQQALVDILMAGDDANVALSLRRAVRLRGRIVFESGTPALPRSFTVQVVPADGIQNSSDSFLTIRDDWTFEGTVYPGWRALLRATTPEGWSVRRVTAGGRNVTDAALELVQNLTDVEVVLTNKVTQVTGMVRDTRGNLASDAAVIVLADDPQKWGPFTRYVRASRLDRTGRFTISGLPPGRYVAVAVDALEEGEEGDPELLARLRPRGVQVELGDAESRTVDLVLAVP